MEESPSLPLLESHSPAGVSTSSPAALEQPPLPSGDDNDLTSGAQSTTLFNNKVNDKEDEDEDDNDKVKDRRLASSSEDEEDEDDNNNDKVKDRQSASSSEDKEDEDDNDNDKVKDRQSASSSEDEDGSSTSGDNESKMKDIAASGRDSGISSADKVSAPPKTPKRDLHPRAAIAQAVKSPQSSKKRRRKPPTSAANIANSNSDDFSIEDPIDLYASLWEPYSSTHYVCQFFCFVTVLT